MAQASTSRNMSLRLESRLDLAIPEPAQVTLLPPHAAPAVAAMLAAQGGRDRAGPSRERASPRRPTPPPGARHSVRDAFPYPLLCCDRLTVPEAFIALSLLSPPPTKGSSRAHAAAHHNFVVGSPALSKPRAHWLLGLAFNQICFFIGSRYTNLLEPRLPPR